VSLALVNSNSIVLSDSISATGQLNDSNIVSETIEGESNVLICSEQFNLTDLLHGSVEFVSFGAPYESDEFTASRYATTNGEGEKSDSGLLIATRAGAAIGAVICLGVFVVGAVFLMKRVRREDVTDCGIEYEAEGHGVELQCSESEDNCSENWNIHGFEDAIESTFDAPTQGVHSPIDHSVQLTYHEKEELHSWRWTITETH
jgi:hypothetical protein